MNSNEVQMQDIEIFNITNFEFDTVQEAVQLSAKDHIVFDKAHGVIAYDGVIFGGSQGGVPIPGAQGAQGTQGPSGSASAQGAQGIQGEAGLNGSDGSQGADGAQGSDGLQGIQGLIGETGAQGEAGLNGSDGSQGADGAQGSDGLQGSQGISGLELPMCTPWMNDNGAQTPSLQGVQGKMTASIMWGGALGVIQPAGSIGQYVPNAGVRLSNMLFPNFKDFFPSDPDEKKFYGLPVCIDEYGRMFIPITRNIASMLREGDMYLEIPVRNN